MLEITKPQTSAANFAPYIRLMPSTVVNNTGLTNIFMGTSAYPNYGISLNAWRFGTNGLPKFVIQTHINNNTGVDRFTIDQDGNVGIGTVEPSAKLDVSGSAIISGGLSAGSANISGALTGQTITTINDSIALNTAKTGITANQAEAIIANSAKNSISTSQSNAIAANTLKVGITTTQRDAIVTNTAKVGITASQASKITANGSAIFANNNASIARDNLRLQLTGGTLTGGLTGTTANFSGEVKAGVYHIATVPLLTVQFWGRPLNFNTSNFQLIYWNEAQMSGSQTSNSNALTSYKFPANFKIYSFTYLFDDDTGQYIISTGFALKNAYGTGTATYPSPLANSFTKVQGMRCRTYILSTPFNVPVGNSLEMASETDLSTTNECCVVIHGFQY